MSAGRVLKLWMVDADTGELLEEWIADEDPMAVKQAIENGSRYGLSVYPDRAEYDAAQAEG